MQIRGSVAVLDVPPWGTRDVESIDIHEMTTAASEVAENPKPGQTLHRYDAEAQQLAETVFDFVRSRLGNTPQSIDPVPTACELQVHTGELITETGLGANLAFRSLTDLLSAQSFPVTHPRALSFVNHSPAVSATLADIALSAASVFADWWLDGAGAIHAENQALRWLADLAGFPESAGGTFLSGGTVANLTAMHVARCTWVARNGRSDKLAIAATREAHSSIRLAARVLDVELVTVPGDELGRMTEAALAEMLATTDRDIFVVATTSGCTNNGAIDDLRGVAAICQERNLWFHVDGAYGGGALASRTARPLFAGIELADSLVIDPHKWLFAPVDCSTLLYRDPELARRANTQAADYLDVIDGATEWNPSDYGIHMTRRARGVPLWFTLVAHGTEAFDSAIDTCLSVAKDAAKAIDESNYLQLVCEPQLSVVLFRRVGWDREEYLAWSRELERTGLGQIVPTSWNGEMVLRICVVNPRTTVNDIRQILETLK